MKAALIFDKNQACTTGWYIKKVLDSYGMGTEVFEPKEIETIYNYKPDFIMAVDSGAHYIADIKIHPKILWLIDTHISYICDEVMAKSFDLVFVAQKNDSEKLKRKIKNVYWLPLAADPEFHGKKDSIDEYDIALVGGFGHGRRKVIMEKLKGLYPKSHIGPAECRKIGEIYSKSKIVVNRSIKNDLNMRVFEGLCSGSLVITDEIKENGFEDIFGGRDVLVTYSSFGNLKDKIDYYLLHDEERLKIGNAGREFVLEGHTYKSRVDSIMTEMQKFKFDGTEPDFNRLNIELRFKKVIWLIMRIIRRTIWRIQELA